MFLSNKGNSIRNEPVRRYYPDNGTIARAVKKTVETGCFKKNTDPEEGRVVRLFLTKKIWEVIPALHTVNRELEDMVCTGLTFEDLSRLCGFLHLIAWDLHTIMENAASDGNE